MNSPLHPVHEKKWLERYNASERINHWIVALSFIVLMFSGLALYHPTVLSWMGFVLGGGAWNRIIHPFVGLLMFVSFMILVMRLWSHNLWKARDTEWMKHIKSVAAGDHDSVPDVGRYNGGQKLLVYVLIVLMIALLGSGIIIWREFFDFPIPVRRIAVVVHAASAIILICSIIVHVYAAFWIKGSMQAMLEGKVSYGWAWRHHRLWFRDKIKEEKKSS